jgi:hypothetical protein
MLYSLRGLVSLSAFTVLEMVEDDRSLTLQCDPRRCDILLFTLLPNGRWR